MRVLPIALFAVAVHAAQASVVDRKCASRDLQDDIIADDKNNSPPQVPHCGVPGTPCCHEASGKDALSYPCLDGTGCNYDWKLNSFDITTSDPFLFPMPIVIQALPSRPTKEQRK